MLPAMMRYLCNSTALAGASLGLQRAQDALTGASVNGVAEALLFGADGGARFFANGAVGGADVVAAHDEHALQLAALAAGEAGVVGGPGRGEGGGKAAAARKV